MRLDRRIEMYGGRLAEMDRGQVKGEILDLIFRLGRGREIMVDQRPPVDRNAINGEKGKGVQRIDLLRLRLLWHGGSRRPWSQRGKVCDAILVLDHSNQWIAQCNLFDLDLFAEQRQQLHTDVERTQGSKGSCAEGRIVHDRESDDSGTDARPDCQPDALQFDFPVQRVFDERLVLILIRGEVDEKRKRKETGDDEDENDEQTDQNVFHGRLLAQYKKAHQSGQTRLAAHGSAC